MPKVRCPKCGEEGWLIKKKLKGKWYLYVDHYEGKGKHRVHYLGPASKFPELARLLGIELEAVSSKDNSELVTSYQQVATNKLPVIPSYQEFRSFVEVKAREGNEDAKKLMKRISKDKAVIDRTLKLLSIYLMNKIP